MAPRATWKGVLKIALVTIPIKVFPATESSKGLAFHQLHEPCKTRISQQHWCVSCLRQVENAEIVKGFEFEPGRYVLLEAAELEAVQPVSTRIIDLVQFAPPSELERRAIDRAYYLVPDGADGGPAGYAYAVLRCALGDRVGIGKLAIYGREYLVAVAAQDQALMLYTLHHAAELRAIDVELVAGVQAGDVALARRVLDAFARPLDLADFQDAYQRDVRRLIDAKVAGQDIVVSPAVETPSSLPLLEALQQSLAAVAPTKARPAKAGLTSRKRAS